MNQKESKKILDFSKLPPHACSYCGIHDRTSVALCLKCNKWFCNNKLTQHKKSDLYIHLTRSGHTAITTDLGQWTNKKAISCFSCGKRDLHQLFLQANTESITIFCTKCSVKIDPNVLEIDGYTPLLQEKRLPHAILPTSPQSAIKQARQLSYKHIAYIEHQWRMGKDPRNEEIMGIKVAEPKPQLPKIKEAYNSVSEYIETNMPIIQREEDDDKREKETWFKHHLSVKWDQKKYRALVKTPEDTYFNLHLRCGDKVRLSHGGVFSAEGSVEYAKDQELCLTFSRDTKFPHLTEGFVIKYLWTNVTFERMKGAVGDLQKKASAVTKLQQWILNPPTIANNSSLKNKTALDLLGKFLSLRKIAGLNPYQLQAIYRALTSEPLSLIQGPPGTGKTITLTAIIYLLLQTISKKKKILVCAPSNIAVDNLAEELKRHGVNVLRVYSRTRELSGEVRESLNDVSLHEKIQKGKSEEAKKLKQYLASKKDQEWLPNKQQKEFKKLREKRETQFINEARVVCCTCITAGDTTRLKKSVFKYVVVDEAAQSLESETLIPLQYQAEKMILAGDHKQLGPLVKSRVAKEANFGQSLFERLAQKIEPVVLLLQYRMHPEIAEFPSQKFYNNQLDTIPQNNQIRHKLFPWPENKPAFFYDIEGREEEPPYKESYFNRAEASFVAKLIFRLTCSGIKPDTIAIITPYSAQKEYFNELFTKILKDKMLQKIEVASIDGFQGREKDYIIISCVRSNQEIGIGFLNDERRLNVALTRAKYGMIICGNAKVLSQDNLWKELIQHYKAKNLVLSGDLSNLKPSPRV